MCLAETSTGALPLRSVTFHLLSLDDPVDEGADRAGQRLFDGAAGDVAARVRLGHGQRDDRRLSGDRGPIAGERDVAGLQRQIVAGHDGRKRGVHERLNLGNAAKARRQVEERCAPVLDAPAHFAIDGHVGAAEAVDRLLRIADQEEPAGQRPRLAPVGLARIVGGEEQEDLRLQRIGVLELVDEDPLEALAEIPRARCGCPAPGCARRAAGRESRARRPSPSSPRSDRARRAVPAGGARRDRRRPPSGTDRAARAGR